MAGKRQVVMFDVDGVLANFLEAFTRAAKQYDPNVPLLTYGQADPSNGVYQQERWDFDPSLISPRIVDKVWTKIKHPDSTFWLKLAPLANEDTFDWLSEWRADVYYVTSRPGAWAKTQTEAWLKARGIYNPTVIISSLKGEVAKSIGANYSIEDKAGNAVMIKYWAPKCHSYILDWPYNRFPHDIIGSQVRRVDTVEEFLSDVEAGR